MANKVRIYKRADNRYILTGLSCKGVAENIRKGLIDIICTYGHASVADVYDISGVEGYRYTDVKIGWSSMAAIQWRAIICWDELNDWCIKFPETNWDSSHHIEVMPDITQTPTTVNITINTETIDDFDNVFAKVSQYANTITDRDVYISVI